MKSTLGLSLGLSLFLGLFLVGCGENNSSSPSTPTSDTATASIEGQIVAEAGTSFAKLRTALDQSAAVNTSTVYPVSGATVELLQNGSVIATATTDEYGRFSFAGLAAGEYEVKTTASDASVARYHLTVNADQTLSVYGRVMSGDCLWSQEAGSNWENMGQGGYWGNGFCGAAPAQGCRHDGQQWCQPQGSGPHGPHAW